MKKLAVFVHFGCHKTATTSIQKFCFDNRLLLEQNDIAYAPSSDSSGRHVELNQCVLRRDVAMFTHPNILAVQNQLIANYQISVRELIETSKCRNFLFSDEGLDFIRTKTELDRLKLLFPAQCEIIPVITLREKNEWKMSWIESLKKVNNDLDSEKFTNPLSPYCLSENSWFFDINHLVLLLRENFKRVVLIKYQNNMVARFLSEFNIQVEREYELNKTFALEQEK